MSNAGIGHGTVFSLSTDATDTNLTVLAEIKTVTPPNGIAEDVDVTHFGSPEKRREFILGLIDDGEGEFMMNLVPGSATDSLIRTARTAQDLRAYRIALPASAGGTWEIDGTCRVKGYSREIPIDGVMEATMLVRFTGASTEAAGA
ncbi:MAG: phage tail tube protein [Pseudomonadota bacterium]